MSRIKLLFNLAVVMLLGGCGNGTGSIDPAAANGGGVLNNIGIATQAGATSATVNAGKSISLNATGYYSDNSTKSLNSALTWTSSDPTVFSISSSGVATCVGIGTSIISASDASTGTSASSTVTLTGNDITPLTGLIIKSKSTSIDLFSTATISAIGTYQDGYSGDISSLVTWGSSNSSAFSISGTGGASSIGKGTSNITASLSGLTTTALALQTMLPTSITVSSTATSVLVRSTLNLTATGNFSDGSTSNMTSHVTWSSSKTNTISVSSSGDATGMNVGTSNITAYDPISGLTSSAISLQSTDSSAVYQIALSTSSPAPYVTVGNTATFTATGSLYDGNTADLTSSVTWSSSNASAITISSSGVATGVGSGTSTITAYYSTGSITSSAFYLVAKSVSNTSTVQKGGSRQGAVLTLMGQVATLAGSSYGSANGTGTAAQFYSPYGITTDGTNVYVADTSNNLIRQIVISTGVVTTLAGSGSSGSLNGVGAGATFYYPYGITTDGTNVYVADTYNNLIRKIVISTGVVTTLAGSGSSGSLNGVGAGATFYYPYGITTDGTNVYVADTSNNLIRQIVISTGAVTTLAGGGGSGGTLSGSSNGTGTAATFYYPYGITTDGTNVYVADTYNNLIRKIVISTGAVTTLAGGGGGTSVGSSNGIGAAATFSYPDGVTTDGTNLYVADTYNNLIRKIVISSGVVTTAGQGTSTYGSTSYVDSSGATVSLYSPSSITTDGINLYLPISEKIKEIY